VITGAVTAGSWLHVAMTYRQGGELAAYVNGRRIGAKAVADALGASTAPLIMAADGAIDDVRIYSRALSAGAVAALAGGRSCVTPATTWAAAAPDLQCALMEAETGAEVWVGPGVYRPTYGPDRTATFAVSDGVGVYGGFAGNEERRDQRAAQTPLPVLSGDIEANDPVDASGVLTDPAALVGGNALHVVSISSTLTSTMLERLAITGGQADGANGASGSTCGDACGGGLHITDGAPRLSGLLLIGNQAAARGGAIYAEQSNTWIISSTLQANRAGSGGAAFWQGGAPALINSLVAGNLAAEEGGGVYSLESSLRLVNVTVAANQAGALGGGLLLDGGAVTAANIVVGANRAPAGAQLGGSGAAVVVSLVQGGCPAAITCGADVQVGDPLFVDAGAGAPTSLGDYRLLPASPAIDSGDNNAGLAADAPQGATIASITDDLADSPRIMAARTLPPQIDLGAYEATHSPPLFITEPVTKGTTTVEYVYQAIAIAPNEPATRLPIEVVKWPEWLRLEPQADGSALLHGAPPEGWYGYFDVALRSTDSFGVVTEQAFTIHVLQRVYSVFMPQVLR
jgi:predicted outer membrane repeat protein